MRTRDFFAGAYRADVRERRTPNVERSISKSDCNSALDVGVLLLLFLAIIGAIGRNFGLTSCRITSYLRVTITVTLPVPLARLLSALPMIAPLAAALSFTRIA
jgi:hypothetical protein